MFSCWLVGDWLLVESRPGSWGPARLHLLCLVRRQTDGSRKSCSGIAATEMGYCHKCWLSSKSGRLLRENA